MRVAIIDIGSNTVRLLVAMRRGGSIVPIRTERVVLGLGACVERDGAISDAKLAAAADCARRFAKTASRAGAELVEGFVTSPGRQASNGGELLEAVAAGGRVAVRQLSAEEEGALAYEGALLGRSPAWGTVAVCDIGGGSTQIVVGRPGEQPAWFRSVDLGSQRLTRRVGSGKDPIRRAIDETARCFAGVVPAHAEGALVVGGSARSLRRVAGRVLGPGELATAIHELGSLSPKEIARRYAVDDARARTLVAGAVILAEVQRRLGLPLEVARGGLREGAAARLLTRAESAA